MKNKIKKYHLFVLIISFLILGFNFISSYSKAFALTSVFTTPKKAEISESERSAIVQQIKEKEKPLVETKMDSIINNGSLRVKTVYSEKPIYQLDTPLDTVQGLLILNGNSYFAINSEIGYFVNGNFTYHTYNYGPAVTFPFYNNGTLTFPQGDTTLFSCVYPPQFFQDTKFFQMRKYYMNSPLDTANVEQIAENARQFVMTYGEPYIGLVVVAYPVIPPNEQITMFMMLTGQYVNAQRLPAADPPFSPKMVMLGFVGSHLYPTNPIYFGEMAFGTQGMTRVWDYVSGNEYKVEYKGVSIGAYNPNCIPIWPGIIVYSIIAVKPISTQVPDKYSLSQNYPNPFNASTNIKFAVKQAGIVGIKIYDLLGKEVATIANEKMDPGTYEATWNANVSSGTYFYRMTAGDFTDTKKLVIIK